MIQIEREPLQYWEDNPAAPTWVSACYMWQRAPRKWRYREAAVENRLLLLLEKVLVGNLDGCLHED